jgi:RHS repeat-associated protein
LLLVHSVDFTPTKSNLTLSNYTGHAHNDDLGLVYMNARYYISSIGRFASADTLVPDPMNPQQFNRYTYTLNNPLRFTDSTGHCAEYDDECWEYLEFYFCHGLGCSGPDGWQQWIIAVGDSIWTIAELAIVRQALQSTRSTLEVLELNWIAILGGDLVFRKTENLGYLGQYMGRSEGRNEIQLGGFYVGSSYFNLDSEHNAFRIVLHEIGHAVDYLNGDLRQHLDSSVNGYHYRAYGRDSQGEGYADAFAAWMWHDARTRQGVSLPADHVLWVTPPTGQYSVNPDHVYWERLYHQVVRPLWDLR